MNVRENYGEDTRPNELAHSRAGKAVPCAGMATYSANQSSYSQTHLVTGARARHSETSSMNTKGSDLNAVAASIPSCWDDSRVVRAKASASVTIERDGRTMNNMDPETKAVHIRLERWGAETRERLSGYPAATLLGRLIEQGPMGAAQSGKPPVELSDASARVDACVGKLCQIDQRALKFYYQQQISREILARKLSMRERQAQNVLRRARWRVQAYLSAME